MRILLVRVWEGGAMDLIGTPNTTELGYLLLLAGAILLAIVFAIQTALLSRKLRLREAHGREMEELAFFDPLTHLPNRRLLRDRLQRALYSAQRNQQGAAVYFIDLDRFKEINDRFGHALGDEVLAELSRRWSSGLRATDTLARWGGDEFVVVTEGIASAADIETVIHRLQRVAASPVQINGEQVDIQLSSWSCRWLSGYRGPGRPDTMRRFGNVPCETLGLVAGLRDRRQAGLHRAHRWPSGAADGTSSTRHGVRPGSDLTLLPSAAATIAAKGAKPFPNNDTTRLYSMLDSKNTGSMFWLQDRDETSPTFRE